MPARQLTPNEIKQRFEQHGETIAGWAGRHGFPRDSVYAILSGRVRGKRGQAHAIAIALGLKANPNEE